MEHLEVNLKSVDCLNNGEILIRFTLPKTVVLIGFPKNRTHSLELPESMFNRPTKPFSKCKAILHYQSTDWTTISGVTFE